MSLINDALKRAREAQQKNNPAATTPMRPTEPGRKKWDLGQILPAIIIVLLITALALIGLAIVWRSSTTRVAGSETNSNSRAAMPGAAVSSAASGGSTATNTPAPRTNHLQGIAYDPHHPWAIISGKTVFVGDVAEGLRVQSISQNAVTLVGNGRTNVLTLDQKK